MKPFSPFASRSGSGLWRSSVSEIDRPIVDGERSRWAEPEGLRMEVPTEKKMKDNHVRNDAV